ncbi:hypothetical protein A2G06_16455 (plasmid) [Geobacter anodireducens]|nr:hypothetical protein A2G06_16455 [Geobacter anodireducens]
MKDKGSLRKMWRIILISLSVAILAKRFLPYAICGTSLCEEVALVFLCLGLAIRWGAVIYLGKYFTVNVAITRGHSLVVTGPYRYVRHPSYTGLLLTFLGLAVLTNNWIGLIVLTVPVFFAVSYRIRVEESVMSDEFGSDYAEYCSRTKKLIPLVY